MDPRRYRSRARAARPLARSADATPHEGASEESVLAACYAASASDLQLLGAAPGARPTARASRVVPSTNEPLAQVGGVNVPMRRSPSARVTARDATARAGICCARRWPRPSRPRFDGRVRLGFKAAWRDGTHAVLLDPLDRIDRPCALVLPPRFTCCATTVCSRPLGRARRDRARARARRAPLRSCRSWMRARHRSRLHRPVATSLGLASATRLRRRGLHLSRPDVRRTHAHRRHRHHARGCRCACSAPSPRELARAPASSTQFRLVFASGPQSARRGTASS